jgi:transcriptional regulator GlxA family with amidase domain
LVVDGIYNTELIAPFDVFQHVQFQKGGGAGIEVFTISPDGGPVTTFEGLRLTPDYGFDNHPPVDILVVASADGSRDRDRQNERMVEWVRRVGGEARYVMSLCWGAFILGEAGLLDGHAATTFPGDYALFAETFPATEVRVNVSFVQDGRVLTSQGGVRSFDVAMHLVEELFGLEVAQGIGGGLLIPWPPDFSHLPPFEVRRPAPASPG